MIDLLSSTAYLIVNKKLSKEVGLDASALLADLISKQVYFENEKGVTDYFFNTVENIQKDTTLSVYKQRTAIAKLKGLGLISVKRKGIPAKRYFKVNAEQVMQFLHNKGLTNQISINNNKIINNNNKDNIIERRNNFINGVMNLVVELTYPQEVAEEFINYWTETNKSNTKMLFELKRTWNTKLRMNTWLKRNKQWNKSVTPKSKIDSQLDEYNKGKQYLTKN